MYLAVHRETKVYPSREQRSGLVKSIVCREVCSITCTVKGAKLISTLEKCMHNLSQVESRVTELFPMLAGLKVS